MALDADLVGMCRRIVERQRELFAAHPGISARTVYEGVGEGGDRALAIDRRCEEVVFAELDALAEGGLSFRAISEERGEVAFGDEGGATRVVIDPIDGSLNARRTIPSHCLSLAVADGPTMADVQFGYVYDFGADEEFVAERGGGARLGADPLRLATGRRGDLEVVGLESAEPGLLVPVLGSLEGRTWRVRSVGAIAISLSYVAAARFDAMLSARSCRSVDAAAGQLIVREAGGEVAFDGVALEDAPLALGARYRVAAAITASGLEIAQAAQGATVDPG